MKIAIIGSGNMAHAIGTRVVAGGHALSIYDRIPEKAKALAEKLGAEVRGESLGDTIEGDVIILAVPYAAMPEVIEKYKDQFSGKIVVDISNPIDFQTFELLTPVGSSAAEEIAKQLPSDVKVVKAFNTTFSNPLLAGEVDGKKLDVFIAGNDQEAKNMIKQLAEDGGLRGLDAGPLKRARYLEGFSLIHMSLQQSLGTNWMSSIKILP